MKDLSLLDKISINSYIFIGILPKMPFKIWSKVKIKYIKNVLGKTHWQKAEWKTLDGASNPSKKVMKGQKIIFQLFRKFDYNFEYKNIRDNN